MTFFSDIKDVSESAINQLSETFNGLPRPLLAAIGAGDAAVEQLARLRQQVADTLASDTDSDDSEKSFASDLPSKAQKIASDVAAHMNEFAQAAPEKAQRLIGELPGKATELGEQFAPENLRGTLESYTQFVGKIYGSLADRGDQTVTKARQHATDKTSPEPDAADADQPSGDA